MEQETIGGKEENVRVLEETTAGDGQKSGTEGEIKDDGTQSLGLIRG